ncbi:hypothetical protein D3C79_660580 [compost metagenome]
MVAVEAIRILTEGAAADTLAFDGGIAALVVGPVPSGVQAILLAVPVLVLLVDKAAQWLLGIVASLLIEQPAGALGAGRLDGLNPFGVDNLLQADLLPDVLIAVVLAQVANADRDRLPSLRVVGGKGRRQLGLQGTCLNELLLFGGCLFSQGRTVFVTRRQIISKQLLFAGLLCRQPQLAGNQLFLLGGDAGLIVGLALLRIGAGDQLVGIGADHKLSTVNVTEQGWGGGGTSRNHWRGGRSSKNSPCLTGVGLLRFWQGETETPLTVGGGLRFAVVTLLVGIEVQAGGLPSQIVAGEGATC